MSAAVRVGIIDSGVNLAHPHIGGIAGGVTISAKDQTLCDGFEDRLGHGTAVAAVIHQYAPLAQLFAVKVFDRTLATNLATLLAAVNWCIDNGMTLINLSLGTTNIEHRSAFETAVARAVATGAFIVSAAEIDGVPSFPGCLLGGVAVVADAGTEPDKVGRLNRNGREVMTASPWAREISGVPRERNLHGISFAVARVTGTMAATIAAQEESPNGKKYPLIP
jgi:subtilisin family serine protease